MSNQPKRDFSLPAAAERVESVVDEELRFHIEERRAELLASGMSAEQAEAEVRRRFGDVTAYREEVAEIDRRTIRSQRRADFITTLLRESRRATRLFTRERGFATVAVGTLVVGLAAVVAMFAVLDAVVLKPLPYPEPDRLVALLHPATVPGSGERRWGLSPGGYIHLKQHARTLADVGIYRSGAITVTGGGDAELARVGYATHEVFTAFRATPQLGRLFDATDDKPGAAPIAVISAEYHERRFGGNPSIVGSLLETPDGNYEIVGVTRPGLTLPLPGPFADVTDLAGFGVDVWIPLTVDPAGPFYNNHPFVGVARLAPDVDIASAQTELSSLLQRFPEWMPQAYSTRFFQSYNFRLSPFALREAVLGAQVPRVLWSLFAAVLLVLVAATANVGNLFLARFEARRRESALRSALGASGSQMAAHYVAEATLVVGGATVAAIALAAAALAALPLIAPRDIPRLHTAGLGSTAVLLGVGLGAIIALVLGTAPLLRRALDVGALRDGSRGLSPSPRQKLLRQALVVAQVAASMVLLSGAWTMMRAAQRLRAVEPGFVSEGVLTFNLSLPFATYNTREKAAAFHRTLQEKVAALPGVESVGTGVIPFRDFGTGCSVVFREGRPYDPGEQTPCVSTPTVAPGFFAALGIDVEGATPSWRDVDQQMKAVVVTRALANRLWPNENPIGKGINSNGSESPNWYRIVGVVPELRAEALDAPPTEAVFYSADGLVPGRPSGALNDLAVLVRVSTDDPMELLPAIRDILRELDARVPIIAPETMSQVLSRSTARTRFTLALIGTAALIALVLSVVGTYGVMSYLVAQRRSELGIRVALGATSSQVTWLVVRQSAALAALGVALGGTAALAANRALGSVITGTERAEPTVLAGVALLLVLSVLAASALPARRAASIEPLEAMRG